MVWVWMKCMQQAHLSGACLIPALLLLEAELAEESRLQELGLWRLYWVQTLPLSLCSLPLTVRHLCSTFLVLTNTECKLQIPSSSELLQFVLMVTEALAVGVALTLDIEPHTYQDPDFCDCQAQDNIDRTQDGPFLSLEKALLKHLPCLGDILKMVEGFKVTGTSGHSVILLQKVSHHQGRVVQWAGNMTASSSWKSKRKHKLLKGYHLDWSISRLKQSCFLCQSPTLW